MRNMSKIFTLSFILLISVFSLAMAEDASLDYVINVADYFHQDYDQVNEIQHSYVKIEELPVVYYIAQLSKSDPIEVAKMRADGNSWGDVVASYNLKVGQFYVMTTKESKSSAYNATFAKFSSTPTRKWNTLDLEDSEFVNLVNLRFIYKHHDYNPYVVMGMQALGKDFVKINKEVSVLKAKLIERQMAQAEENK